MTRVSLQGRGGGALGTGRWVLGAGLEGTAVSRSLPHTLPFLFSSPRDQASWTSGAGVRPRPGERILRTASFFCSVSNPPRNGGRQSQKFGL